jgi:TATA-box binding protein (TBP) (component of TFIID and TFIIIB)
MVEWKINNAVFTLKFDKTLNLDIIANELLKYDDFFISYDPETFPGLVIKIGNSKKTYGITIFRTGTVNVYGIKDNVNKIYDIIKLLKRLLSRCGIELPDPYLVELKNVIISGKFDYNNIDIERMYKDFDDAIYEPEQFPAVTIYYHISKDYKIAFNIFKGGKFIGAGIRCDLNSVYQHIDEIVNSFQENVIKKYAKVEQYNKA